MNVLDIDVPMIAALNGPVWEPFPTRSSRS
ncbi:hypothetical protein V1289_000553 [Bradyrhizobium sp. AZCC 2289]